MNNVLVTIAPATDALHQHELPGAQGGERNDQLRQVPKGRIEQAADSVAGLGGNGFCGVTQEPHSGTMAKTDSTNNSVCASGLS